MKKIAIIDNYTQGMSEKRRKGFQNAFKSVENLLPPDVIPFSDLKILKHYQKMFSYDGLILTGSPATLADPKTVEEYQHIIRLVMEFQKPILGICFGHELFGKAYGFEVVDFPKQLYDAEWNKEIPLNLAEKYDLLPANTKSIQVEVVHHQEIKYSPHFEDIFYLYASSELCKIQLIKHKSRPLYGTQFHPETLISEATKYWGTLLLRSFILQL